MKTEVIRSARRRKTVQARVVDGVLRVMIPAGATDAEEARWVEEMREKLGRKTSAAAINLPERAHALATRYGLPEPRSIKFSSRQKMRWGSCTPDSGAIRVSDRLTEFPLWVLDYVIVHELAHLVEANHSAAFWNLVAGYPLAERARGFLLAKQDG
jgi:predicted metal-dependent hydrolase